MGRPENSSKYKKYDEQIKSSLKKGKTHQMIVDELNELSGTYDGFSDRGLRYYCAKNGLVTYRSKVYHSGTFTVNICDECKHCRFVTSATGNKKVRLCEKANRMIACGCKATTWCPLQDLDF